MRDSQRQKLYSAENDAFGLSGTVSRDSLYEEFDRLVNWHTDCVPQLKIVPRNKSYLGRYLSQYRQVCIADNANVRVLTHELAHHSLSVCRCNTEGVHYVGHAPPHGWTFVQRYLSMLPECDAALLRVACRERGVEFSRPTNKIMSTIRSASKKLRADIQSETFHKAPLLRIVAGEKYIPATYWVQHGEMLYTSHYGRKNGVILDEIDYVATSQRALAAVDSAEWEELTDYLI